jgi:hypothetical protein
LRDAQLGNLRQDILERVGRLAGTRDHLEVAVGRAILQHLRFRIAIVDVDLNGEDGDRVVRVGPDVLTAEVEVESSLGSMAWPKAGRR